MKKIAIIIFSDSSNMESLGRISNAFMVAKEAVENGDDLKIIFEGAGTKGLLELEKDDNMLHELYLSIKPKITGVCKYCSNAFGVKNEIEKLGLPLLSEYKEHPSLRNLIVEGYNLITF